ncbi:MAG: hypothetical protein COU30_01280 [Candidatus Magasanikbacteria bacterium CG10_big_fil_rev_8_21_14_0_10_38_6]|uniref:Polymerase beta nucleotidyltransferase domain-containing protein n=1 Tax=Candidatus Magasanikbacteria bacterium CG10_big_fil_rev_8_21_14_0_10_38_6 TaxID=1974647 RepID=A0A2M6P1P2_9BACT|nr:MAG: hypothetical protein COU30_01280 [Candidatus Magasanikbacteria bacterium CG10_big_fil_rev_8_21_14_0_10_38_6]
MIQKIQTEKYWERMISRSKDTVFLRREQLSIIFLLTEKLKLLNMKHDYTKTINAFTKKFLKKEKVLAVLVTGSFAQGTNNKDSDLDIQIITSNTCKFRKRGNIVMDGILIEYCINPYRQVKKYLEIDAKHNNPMMCIALLEGKIIFEKYKSASLLKEYAAACLRNEYNSINKDRISFNKYVLADTLNKMNSLYKKHRDDFPFLYYINLKLIYETYAVFLQQPLLKEPMLKDYFEGNVRFNHVLKDFIDKEFAKMFLLAMVSKNSQDQIVKYRELTQYVLNKMGGFSLDGWSLRIPVDYGNKMDKRTRIF